MIKKTFNEMLQSGLQPVDQPDWNQLDASLLDDARGNWAIEQTAAEIVDCQDLNEDEILATCLSMCPTTFYLQAGLRAFPDVAAGRKLQWAELLKRPVIELESSPEISRELLGICMLFLVRTPEEHPLSSVFNAHYSFYESELLAKQQA